MTVKIKALDTNAMITYIFLRQFLNGHYVYSVHLVINCRTRIRLDLSSLRARHLIPKL